MSTNSFLEAILQALLFASSAPLTTRTLSEISQENTCVVEESLKKLQQEWASSSRVLQLCCTGAGWQVSIRGEFAPYLQKLFAQKPHKLSKAVLETLALIAYRGPITRSEIEEVRGVVVNPTTLRQLIDAQWVESIGHKEAPGRPQLFATTKKFLSDFQLRALKDLPEYHPPTSIDLVDVCVENALEDDSSS